MKRIVSILALLLCIISVQGQKGTIIDDDIIDENGRHCVTSKKKVFRFEQAWYEFRVQAIADKEDVDWYLLIASRYSMPKDNVILFKFEDNEIEKPATIYVKSDTTTVYQTQIYSYMSKSGFGHAYGEGKEVIDKIRNSAVYSMSPDLIDKIALYKVTKTRIGDDSSYVTRKWNDNNALGSFINRCWNDITRSLVDVNVKKKSIYDGF